MKGSQAEHYASILQQAPQRGSAGCQEAGRSAHLSGQLWARCIHLNTIPRGDTSTSSERGLVRLTRLGRSVLTRLNRLCCSDHLCAVAPCLVKTHRLLEPFTGHLCYQPHHHIRAAQQLDSSGGLVHTSISLVDHQSHTDLEQP